MFRACLETSDWLVGIDGWRDLLVLLVMVVVMMVDLNDGVDV